MQRIGRRLTHLVRGDEGQAMVEAALVLPLMTFLVVGVIQLVMIQHARALTEYAAPGWCTTPTVNTCSTQH
jgi:Flp pilus assembly protein TadG